MTDSNKISNLANYIGNGYNLTENNFLGSPIFSLTYGQSIEWGDRSVEIPNEISFSNKNTHITMTSDKAYANVAEFQSAFASSISVEYTGFTYSGSAEANYRAENMSKTDTSARYFNGFYVSGLAQLERLSRTPGQGFDPQFTADFQSLLESYESAPYSEIATFFKKYGTHYLASCFIGGHASIYISVNTSKVEQSSMTSFEGKVSAEMNAVFASGSVSASAMRENSSFLSEYEAATEVLIRSYGGGQLESDAGNLAKWEETIFSSPQVLIASDSETIPPAELHSLVTLVDEFVSADSLETVKAWFEKKLCEYLLKEAMKKEGASLFLPSFPINNQTQKNWGPAFLLANIRSKDQNDHGYVIGCGDPSGGTFGTNRVGGSVLWSVLVPFSHYYADVAYDSCLLPTANNIDSALISVGESELTTSYRAFSLMDPGEQSLGDWQDLTDKIAGKAFADIVPETDGLLVGYLDGRAQVSDETASSATMTVKSGTVALAGCSQQTLPGVIPFSFNVPVSSFTCPVRAGETYLITTENEVNEVQLMFLPVQSGLALDTPVQLSNHLVAKEAQKDGFLTAHFFTEDSAETEMAIDGIIYVADDSDGIEADDHIAAKTSLQYAHPSVGHAGARKITNRTLCVPVSKGQFMKVNVAKSSGNEDPTYEGNALVYWHPIRLAD